MSLWKWFNSKIKEKPTISNDKSNINKEKKS